jgi:Acyl-CoA reductase (LuxC)
MTAVRFFLGVNENTDLLSALDHAKKLPVWSPFDARAMAFVGRFSQRLLMHSRIRSFPELAALGHWFRPARLRDMAKAHPAEEQLWVRRGRGLAFHVAPANVDSVFMYSWLLSLLAGNVNWVRVSQKTSAQLDILLEVLREVLQEAVGEAVNGRFVLMTYPHDANITAALSNACMVRVVWGGDETVAAMRAIPLSPTAVEICFPDRFSAASLRADVVLHASDTELQNLAGKFYNDAFWFAQQACSSPRLLAWVGSESECTQAQHRFWEAVRSAIARKDAENTPAMNMARLGAAFEMAAQGIAKLAIDGSVANFPSRLVLETQLSSTVKHLHCGNGLFLEMNLSHLQNLAPQLSAKEQTLAVYGFSRHELLDFVDALPARAVDRIVPIGEALSFDAVWDGVDLLDFYTRQISLPFSASISGVVLNE